MNLPFKDAALVPGIGPAGASENLAQHREKLATVYCATCPSVNGNFPFHSYCAAGDVFCESVSLSGIVIVEVANAFWSAEARQVPALV
jgi:hypothetical protein